MSTRVRYAFYEREESLCSTCPFDTHNRVWGEGNPASRLAVFGEAPGAEEDAMLHPFVGNSGKLLNRLFAATGIERRSIWISNCITCRPPQNTFDSPEALGARRSCYPGFKSELTWLEHVDVVLALGNSAMRFFGLSSGITKVHGEVFPVENIQLVPTYHPSFILRGGGEGSQRFGESVEDFNTALRLVSR